MDDDDDTTDPVLFKHKRNALPLSHNCNELSAVADRHDETTDIQIYRKSCGSLQTCCLFQ
jgi:hypothetical protein